VTEMTALPALLGGPAVRPEGPPAWPFPDPAVQEALQAAYADGSWGRYFGPNVEGLTAELAAYHNAGHVLLCASGTAAVELALRGVKIRAGDEVILAAYEFKANMQNILLLGATPVLVDIAAENWNLDPQQLSAAVSERTRAILVSHLHGGVVPMPALREFADHHGLVLIEDACQMPGAQVYGRRAGMWGDVGVLSFGGSKLLSAGRGGAVLTRDSAIAQRIRLYTQRGNEAYPLSELQAAVVRPQLAALDANNRRRAERVEQLCTRLRKVHGLVPFRNADSESHAGYYKLGLQYNPAAFGGLDRERFCKAMRAEGIALDPGFRSLHLTHSPSRFRAAGELRHATDADARVVVLHHPILLGSSDDVEQIVTAIEKVRSHAALLRDSAALP